MSNYDYRVPPEMVDHPKHYNAGTIEAIALIEDQGLGEAFCAGNVMKYIISILISALSRLFIQVSF